MVTRWPRGRTISPGRKGEDELVVEEETVVIFYERSE